MSSIGGYPDGARDSPLAPWNQPDPEEIETNVFCSQTLSKTVPVISYEDTDDSWEDIYHENDYHTPQQLLELFKRYLQDMVGEKVQVSKSPSYLKRLIKECSDWMEDDLEFMED